jgi:adenylate cyclase
MRDAVTAKLRLFPIVLACVGCLVLASAGSIFAVHVFTTRTIVTDLVSRVVGRSLSGLELALRGYLDPAKYQAEAVADAIRSGELNFIDREKLAEYLAGLSAAAPQITVLVVADAAGNAVRVARTPLGKLETEWLAVESDCQLDRMARETEARKEPFWGPPVYAGRLKESLLNLRMPVWQNDDYLGFVAIGISTQQLSQLALELSDPPRSTVFVLYGRDKVLAHMFLVLQTDGLSADKPLLAASEIVDPVIERLDDAKPNRQMQYDQPKGISILELEAGGTRYLAITKTIAGYGHVPLRVGAYSVASEVDAPLRTMFRAAIIGSALLAVALILTIIMSRMITRPIRETADSVAAVAALDFEKAAPLARSSIKELDDLSNSFNAMLVGLKSFGRYVPLALVKRLIRENRVGAGTEERDLTVMFTDIAGFTPICEGMNPSQVADFINHHLTIISSCIEHEGGTIDKYIGDAVMAFWGAPDRIEDAPTRAVRAAIAIHEALAADNQERAATGLAPVRTRVGIHSGPLIVGDIGAPNRINYTVVGDVVNVAQRLESLGKEVDPLAETIVLISEASKNGLDDTFELTRAGRFRVKGKQKELEVYRVVFQADTVT